MSKQRGRGTRRTDRAEAVQVREKLLEEACVGLHNPSHTFEMKHRPNEIRARRHEPASIERVKKVGANKCTSPSASRGATFTKSSRALILEVLCARKASA